MTEVLSMLTSTHPDPGHPCPVLLAYCPGQGRYGRFRASEGMDSRPHEIGQALQVVAGRHHRHGEVRPGLPNRANELAAHLHYRGKRVLDPGANLGNPLVTPLLASRQRLVPLALALDMAAPARRFELIFPRLGRIPPIRIHVPAGVEFVQHGIEMLAIVGARRSRRDLADHLVLFIHIHRQLVPEVASAMLLRPGGVHIFLPPLGRHPGRQYRTLANELLLFPAQVLPGGQAPRWRR